MTNEGVAHDTPTLRLLSPSPPLRCAAGDLTKERGAVMEEWRMNRDSNGRSQEANWKLILQGSKWVDLCLHPDPCPLLILFTLLLLLRYADRLPIGLEKIIRGVSPPTIKAFYERWYRPENMAVVIVGDMEDAGEAWRVWRVWRVWRAWRVAGSDCGGGCM